MRLYENALVNGVIIIKRYKAEAARLICLLIDYNLNL